MKNPKILIAVMVGLLAAGTAQAFFDWTWNGGTQKVQPQQESVIQLGAPSAAYFRNILFEPNNTYDIGSTSPQNAPKDIYAIGTTSSGTFNSTSTTATSTGANGWNLTKGCFAI